MKNDDGFPVILPITRALIIIKFFCVDAILLPL